MTIYPVFPQFFAEELERPMPMLRRCSQTANQDTFWRGRPLNHLAGMVHFPAIGAFEHNIPVLVRVSGSQYAFFAFGAGHFLGADQPDGQFPRQMGIV